MSAARSIRRTALAGVLATIVLSSVAAPGQALAAQPWWRVNTISAPPGAKGGEATIDLYISNVGDERTNGTVFGNVGEYLLFNETKNFVTVVDTLPAGVVPMHVYAEGGGTSLGEHAEKEVDTTIEEAGKVPLCSISSQTVQCKYATPVRPYEQIIVAIAATVAPGTGNGTNELAVSGGGATAIDLRRPLALEGASSKSFGIQSYEVNPEEEGGTPATQAGSHPFQLTTSIVFNAQTAPTGTKSFPSVQPLAYSKDVRVNLPPGLIGNPTPLPKCSMHDFALEASSAGHCPADTVVGVGMPFVNDPGVGPAHVPLSSALPIFSLEPSVGEPARFGMMASLYGPVIFDTSVRTGEGYGVTVTVPDVTESVEFIGSQVTFWGVPGDPRHNSQRGTKCIQDTGTALGEPALSCPVEEERPLLIMPTSCPRDATTGLPEPLQATVESDSWANVGQFQARSYTFQNGEGKPIGMDGCNLLSFEPSIGVVPDVQQGSTPTGLTVGVHVPQDADLNPKGLAESAVKDTTVALPEGIVLNPAGADGLQACGLGEIGLENGAEQSCPEAAKVGTVEIHTPLLPDPLTGAVYLAQPYDNPFHELGHPNGSLLALYIVAKDPVSGVLVKLAGEVKPDLMTGQLVSTFQNTPPLPFEDLKLSFFGGSRAPLGTPALCGSYATQASFAPWSGNQPAEVSSPPFEITVGPDGTQATCRAPLPFAPSLTVGSLNLQAGAFTPFTMTMSREDGNQSLSAIQLRMPPGLSGLLTGVKLCGEAEANAGTCGPESQIGETTVSVGLGGSPFTVKGGKVYITGPYQGAPFGLSIVNPAKAGPFDLGQVVVRAKIEVDPTTAALTVTSDGTGPYAIPQILHGIPLQIMHVNVTIDRPGFTFNPTSCSAMTVGGLLTSGQAAASELHVPFQVTNCATLKFKPKFSVSTSGRTSRARGASLRVRLSYPKAPFGSQANIGKVKVDLPRQLPSRLSTLQKACTDKTFDQNPAACPAASRVGTAKATTPLLPVPLNGPAYFVSHGGAKFPELIIVLSGYGVTVDLHGETFISKAGITSSTFRTIPDVPVGTFELNLPQGRDSALAANGKLCKSALKMPTAFTAQNGMSIKQSTRIAVTGCRKRAKKSVAKSRRR